MIINNTNIELFQKGKDFDQILFLDNFYQYKFIDEETGEDIAKLLYTAINFSNNTYVKRSAIKIVCELTLAKKITNRFTLIGYLHDFLSSAEITLQSIALKYLPFFPEAFTIDNEMIIKELSDSSNGEVSSQAYLCLGLFQLTSVICNINITNLISKLSASKLNFKAAEQASENRTDAEFYLLLIEWIEAVLSNDLTSVQTRFNLFEKCIQVRSLYEIVESNLELDFLIFQVVSKIKKSFEISITSEEWYDFPLQIKALYNIGIEIQKLRSVQSANHLVIEMLFYSTFEVIQTSIYNIHLGPEKQHIHAFKEQNQDEQLAKFIESILSTFTNVEKKRKENHELLALLSENLGSKDGLKFYDRIINKEISIVKAFAELFRKNKNNQLSYRTGSIQGHEILLSLMSQINNYLPNYPSSKLEVFFNIVEEVIRYARTTLVGHEKNRFLFLYCESEKGKGKKSVEQDLQDSMYTYFEHSKIADGLDHEKAKFVDGGRVDIVYKRDLITIPIELKKSIHRPDKMTLEQNYIAQAQTYTAGYDQLGIFVLLELSDKSKEPPPNFKDWFKIHHLPPSTNQNVEYPDYLISVVIPGNKTTPSAKSVYK